MKNNIIAMASLVIMGLLLVGCSAAPAAPAAPAEPVVITQPPEVMVVTATPDLQMTIDAQNAEAEAAANDAAPEEPVDEVPATDAPAPEEPAANVGELGYAGNPVLSNSQWIPVKERFEGLEYALVPVGCFQVGDNDGFLEETPEHQVCFDQPFWIGVTEVTNEQYGGNGTFAGEDYPRNNVTWEQAQAFCVSRGGRLPTEAEWEYAVRGPNSFIYTMGDILQPGFVVFAANSAGAATVGSQPDGASWVGALDLLGNLSEWTSTGWEDYPYDSEDGRERGPEAGETRRVVRGGSFQTGQDNLRASFRSFNQYDSDEVGIGFRCARDE